MCDEAGGCGEQTQVPQGFECATDGNFRGVCPTTGRQQILSQYAVNAPIKQSFQARKCLRKAMHSAFCSFLTFQCGTAHRCVYAARLCAKSEYLRCFEAALKVKKSKKLPGFFPHLVWEEFGFYSGKS